MAGGNWSFYTNSARQSSAQVVQAEADLQFQEAQSSNLIWQSQANLAAAKDQVAQAEADLENATLTFKREEEPLQTRRGFRQGIRPGANGLRRRHGAGAILAPANHRGGGGGGPGQIHRRSDRRPPRRPGRQPRTSALPPTPRPNGPRCNWITPKSAPPPTASLTSRAALQGEVVNPGQGIVTLIDPDQLWVRADVEETYIDSIRLGDKLPVRLPSGAERQGTVFFRGIDADYATQRDVSRTKRDIKTFEIRLRCDNDDRALAVGMTAYVTLAPRRP